MTSEQAVLPTPQGPRFHDIGRVGVVVVNVEADDVRIRGVDGTEARVVAPADGAGIETTAQPGRFTVRTGGTARGAFLGIRIGGRGIGIHVSGTIELEVPRDARVEVSAAAGDISVRDVTGGVTVRTASGDVSIKRAGGRIAISVASGDVVVTGADPVMLDVHSISGDVRVRAPRFERVAIETVSGDAELVGTFGTAGGHTISTVSGDVELGVTGGLTLDVKTVSGDVDCDHPDRRSGDGRKRPLVIGDGAARLAVRTMSGDVEVRAGKSPNREIDGFDEAAPADGAAFGFALAAQITPPRAPAAPAAPAAPGAPTAPPPPPVAAPPPPPPTGAPGAPAAPAVPAAPAATVGSAASDAELTQRAPAVGAAQVATVGPGSAADAATLSVLEALARGEIDVLEAERRLANPPAPITVEPAGPVEGHAGG
jgi:hypothetical protein